MKTTGTLLHYLLITLLFSNTLAQSVNASANAGATVTLPEPTQGSCASADLVQLKAGVCLPKTCAKQLAKIMTDKTTKKVGMKFTGSIALTATGIEVTISFPETKNQAVLKTDNTNSCVESQLYNFGNTYAVETSDSATITSTYDDTSSLRVLKFTIAQADFGVKVSKDVQTDKVIIKGLYAFKLLINLNSNKKPLMVNLFGIRVVLSTDMKTIIESQIAPKTIGEAACAADGTCVQTAKSSIKFCTDSTCATVQDSIDIVVDQSFYVKQTISETGFTTGFKPKGGQLTISDGKTITKTVKPEKETQADGQIILELKVKFITSEPITVAVQSELTATTALRYLQETGDNAQVIGSASTGCIKKTSGQTACSTSAEVAAYNPTDCGDSSTTTCNSKFGQILSVIMIIFAFIC